MKRGSESCSFNGFHSMYGAPPASRSGGAVSPIPPRRRGSPLSPGRHGVGSTTGPSMRHSVRRAERALAQPARDQAEDDFGSPRNGRQHQHGEGEHSGESRLAPAEREHHVAQMNRPATIAGQSAHRIDDQAHRSGRAAADLVHEHGRAERKGYREDRRDPDLFQRTDDRVRAAACSQRH